MMHRACLSLGSNVLPEQHLARAIAELRATFATVIVSPVYRTAAIGFEGADFLNAAAIVHTDWSPQTLNDWLHALEDIHGRDRNGPRFGDRPLDIDIVLFDDLVLEGPGNLRIPRSELQHAFVLKPLADIAADIAVPGAGAGCTVGDLWSAHPDHAGAWTIVDLPDC